MKRKIGSPTQKVIIPLITVAVLTISLLTATKIVKSPTNLINKAADTCSSIILTKANSAADILTCNSQYFPSSNTSCQAGSTGNCNTLSATECNLRIYCSLTTNTYTCVGATDTFCDANVSNGCVSNGYCSPKLGSDKLECSGYRIKDPCNANSKCTWKFTSCSGIRTENHCEGTLWTCNSVNAGCPPNQKICNPNLYTCQADSSSSYRWVSTPCSVGTCHPADAYSATAYCQ